ncbi:uncharacterized protein LOC144151937 [Haemaphysalis longicornis]
MKNFTATTVCVFLLTAVPVKPENPNASLNDLQHLPDTTQETGRQATSGLPSLSNPVGFPNTQGTGNVYATQPSLTPTSAFTPTLGSLDPLTQLLMDTQKKSNELVQTYTQQITQLQTKLNQDLQQLAQDLNAAMNALLLQGK